MCFPIRLVIMEKFPVWGKKSPKQQSSIREEQADRVDKHNPNPLEYTYYTPHKRCIFIIHDLKCLMCSVSRLRKKWATGKICMKKERAQGIFKPMMGKIHSERSNSVNQNYYHGVLLRSAVRNVCTLYSRLTELLLAQNSHFCKIKLCALCGSLAGRCCTG